MSANKIGLSSTIGIPIQCQSHLLQKRKRAVKAIPAFSLIRSRERESDLQGSDTSFSSKSAVEEGSQGVALGQVTYFTSLSGQSKALVSYVSLSLGLFSLGEKNQRNTGLRANQ
jgi:hypothetical protein